MIGRTEPSVARRPTTLVGEDSGAPTDDDLIERFLGRGGWEAEEAFRELVVRHGPMVLGVCRHVLDQHQDAEDAFQATFLVLARKAGSIRDRRVLGRWLYEVAYRIAVRARAHAVRRRTQERQGAEMSVTAPESDAGWNELRPVLHEEVNRLPEKYRTPVVLCYLEGKTNEEVAQILRWPVGTVKGRLSRARELLRSRLTRRGLALSAAFLVTAMSRNAVFAEVVPSYLIDSTVDNAMKVSGAGLASAAAHDLPDLSDLFGSPRGHSLMSQVAVGAALLIVIGTALAGVGRLFPGVIPVQLTAPSFWPAGDAAPPSLPCHVESLQPPPPP